MAQRTVSYEKLQSKYEIVQTPIRGSMRKRFIKNKDFRDQREAKYVSLYVKREDASLVRAGSLETLPFFVWNGENNSGVSLRVVLDEDASNWVVYALRNPQVLTAKGCSTRRSE